MFLQGLLAFIGCLTFSIILSAPRKDIFFCGISGGLCWFIYYSVNAYLTDTVVATLAATLMVTVISRFLSHIRKEPSTLFLIPGILPLVPGSGMYYTMNAVLKGNMIDTYTHAVNTLKIAGIISFGIIIVLSLPYSFFNFINIKEK